jgi:hypothetical protein
MDHKLQRLIRGEFNNPSGIKRATAINAGSSLLSTPGAIMGLIEPESRANCTPAAMGTLLSTIAAVLYGMGLRSMLLAASSPGTGRA